MKLYECPKAQHQCIQGRKKTTPRQAQIKTLSELPFSTPTTQTISSSQPRPIELNFIERKMPNEAIELNFIERKMPKSAIPDCKKRKPKKMRGQKKRT